MDEERKTRRGEEQEVPLYWGSPGYPNSVDGGEQAPCGPLWGRSKVRGKRRSNLATPIRWRAGVANSSSQRHSHVHMTALCALMAHCIPAHTCHQLILRALNNYM